MESKNVHMNAIDYVKNRYILVRVLIARVYVVSVTSHAKSIPSRWYIQCEK